ncbi:MAG: M48 family metallopeptidase [Bacteroidales bacterium]|jgi:STE24 endopeptidase|nr:M48 family metallopeptidase [Bacteroidales bacterium]NLM93831.1 M48 family metallopeptidase [Bacteroidales bacterium]
MSNTLLIVILFFLFLDFALERILDYLNAGRWSNRLPDALKGIYDEEKYRKSQDYSRVNMRFGILTSTFFFLLILGVLLAGGFGWLDQLVRQWTENPILMAMIFFAIIALVSDLLSTPFDIYDTFVIEERFGFNKTTPGTYLLDKLKGYLLAVLIGGALIAIFVWFYRVSGRLFWLYAWLFLTVFSVFMMMFYSTLIVPLFNKQTPLEDGPLRDAIEGFAQKVGFKLDNIFVIDGSKRSSRGNAYFSGLGPRKRIVLFDTLIHDHTTEELVAVLAHEVGHYKKKHTLKGMILSVFSSGVILYLLGLFINRPELSLALGGKESSFHLGILAFGLLYTPVTLILGLLGNHYSRKYEFEADAYAACHYAVVPLQEALKKLSVNNLSNLRPHPAYVFFHYSHPPLMERLDHLEKLKTP